MAKDRQMDKKLLEALAKQAAKSIKTENDLCDFQKMLTKVTVDTALNTELDSHLGCDKHEESSSDNSRNGYSNKTLITDNGEIYIDALRDRWRQFWTKAG